MSNMKIFPCFCFILIGWGGNVSGLRDPYKENELVSCGNHNAKDCAGCPRLPGNGGKSYCHGDCFWNTQKSTISCGQHSAVNCAACPQGKGAGYCHGDCKWQNNNCVAKADGVCEDTRECAKKAATSNSQKNRVLVNELNRIRKKLGYTEYTSDQFLANLATKATAQCVNGHAGANSLNYRTICQTYCEKKGMDCHGENVDGGGAWRGVQCQDSWKQSKLGHFQGAYQRGLEQNRGNDGIIGCGMSYCSNIKGFEYRSSCIICTN